MNSKKENNCLSDENIQSFIDGELSENELKLVEMHLSDCENCKARIEVIKTLLDLVSKEMPSIKDSEIIIPEFNLHKVKKYSISKKTKLFWWTAAAFLLLLFSLKIFHSQEKESVEYIIEEISNEIDANKPWHEQKTTLYIFDESGEIIDIIEDL